MSLEDGVLLDGRVVVYLRIKPQRIEVLLGALDLVDLALTKRLLVLKLVRALCFYNEVELGLFAVPSALPSKNNAEIRIVRVDGRWNLVEGQELEKTHNIVIVVGRPCESQ